MRDRMKKVQEMGKEAASDAEHNIKEKAGDMKNKAH